MARRPFVSVPTPPRDARDVAAIAARFPSAVPPVAGEPDVMFSVKIPRALREEVVRRAHAEGVTNRAMVMRGLAALGFDIPEEDKLDRRRKP